MLPSPSHLLTSIQFMKNKLKNDQQLLRDIQSDFNPKQVHLNFNSNADRSPLRQICNNMAQDNNMQKPSSQISKDEFHQETICLPTDSADHKKVQVQLKKRHQKEIQSLKEQFALERDALLSQKQAEFERKSKEFKTKMTEQHEYIQILEEQLSSPIQSERESSDKEKCQQIINQLMRENTSLVRKLEIVKQELIGANAKLSELQKVAYQTKVDLQKSVLPSDKSSSSRVNRWNSKSRLKFSKLNDCSLGEQMKVSHQRSNSIYLSNDQNVNTLNDSHLQSKMNQNSEVDCFPLTIEKEDSTIQDDEIRLRTIRGFTSQQQSNAPNPTNRGYLTFKL